MTDNPKFGPLPPADDDAWLRAAFAVAAAMLNEWHPDDPVEIVWPCKHCGYPPPCCTCAEQRETTDA